VSDENPPFDDEEDFDPEEAERSIAAFIDSANKLGGTSADELASQVLAVMETAQSGIAAILDEQPNNKIIATMLALSRQHREVMDTDSSLQWRLSAASSLVSGFIRPGQG
jgi:hypothetical protein